MNRRDFLARTAALGAGLHLSGRARADAPLPTRLLGRTGREVTILGLGTAPIGEGPPSTDEAERIFGAVLDRGVTYVDTARIYGNAEEALGRLVPARRDELFLVGKVWCDTAAEAERSLTESLRLLRTDHLDLLHIHHIGGRDVDRVLADDGVLPWLVRQKEAGVIGHIGMTGHANPSRFLRLLETDQIDVVMTVLNYADRNHYGFESDVLSACRERGVGVAAMKVYAGIAGGFPNHRNGAVGCATPAARLPAALAYALDLPGVSVAVVGPFTLEQAVQNVDFARAYRPLPAPARAELVAFGAELAPTLGTRYGPNG